MTIALSVARPGIRLGNRPEVLHQRHDKGLDEAWQGWVQSRVDPELRSFKRFSKRLAAISDTEDSLLELDFVQRNCLVQQLRQGLSGQTLDSAEVIKAFALVRIVMEQIIGVRLYDEQLYAAWCLLAGHFIEMQTGEGKTITAAVPATIMALAGAPVHIITANEYLVNRDFEELEPFYRWFGLSAGVVLSGWDEEARQAGYAADITYCTHQQVVFDYLRDARALRGCSRGISNKIRDLLEPVPAVSLQRGLCFAIVDEADSVLIDDARTPLILAETSTSGELVLSEAAVALAIARGLEENVHFFLKTDTRRSRLTESGLAVVRECTARLHGSWQFERYRNERIAQALTALHLYRRDIDYLVHNDRVDLIDQSTGRPTPQRRLQHGLHRMLEVKERCSLGDESNPVSALSFQRFFGRYHKLSGMSGTLLEARRELRQVYGPRVVSIPTVKVSRRKVVPAVVKSTRYSQLQQLVNEVHLLRSAGRAVLIGTRTVKLSDDVSQVLSNAGIEHAVINARQDTEEAAVIAKSGLPSHVTVATNMAGRGTDIKPPPLVLEKGGLHVINLEINDSKRIDRQLHGRAARQGDPGSCQDLLCLDDELLNKELQPLLFRILAYAVSHSSSGSTALIRYLVRYAQIRIETRHQQQRLAVANGQTHLQRALAVGGLSE